MSGFVLDWLRDGVVDIAMLYNVAEQRGLSMHQALTEEIRLFGTPDMTDSPRGDTVSLATSLRLPLIVPSPSHGLRNLIDAAALSIGRHADPAIEIDSYRQIKRLAARRLAFGMLPTVAIEQEIRDGTFRSWRITRPAVMRRIFLGYRTDRPLSAASRAVGQLSWTLLRDLVRSGAWSAVWTETNDLQPYGLPACE